MSVISCQSCGMQFDGTNMQPGVQFKCTGCGAMIQVPAPVAQAGVGRGAVPQRQAGRGGRPVAPRFGQPTKKGNAGVIVGVIVGLIALVIVVVAVLGASGPSPQEEQQAARAEKIAKENEVLRAKNEVSAADTKRKKMAFSAALALSGKLAAALKSENEDGIAALFDWEVFSAINRDNAAADQRYKNSPLFYSGRWDKVDDRFTGKYIGESALSGPSLKKRVLGYFKEFVFGADKNYNKKKSELDDSRMSKVVGGKTYLGYKLFFKFGSGKEKAFWSVALEGSDQAKIIFYKDEGHSKSLASIEAKNKPRSNSSGQDLTDTRRKPTKTGRDGRRTAPSGTSDLDSKLPPARAIGAYPTDPDLINLVKDICERGMKLNTVRRQRMGGKTKAEKKATLGAFIDALITVVKKKDRNLKHRISYSMFEIWESFLPAGREKSDMVYEIGFATGQSNDMLRVRRWIEVYNSYKVE